MTHKEFTKENEHVIVRNNVQFFFYKIQDHYWLLEVIIATLPNTNENGTFHESINAQTTMTSVEAYYAYNNILDGGLE